MRRIEAIRVVAAGDGLIAPSVTRRLIEEFVRRPATRPRVARASTGSPPASPDS